MYYALALSPEMQNRVFKVFYTFFPDQRLSNDWNKFGTHITLVHSNNEHWSVTSKVLSNFLGHKLQFRIIGVGISKNVIAFKVNIKTANEISHITMACKKGHKPYESNLISPKDWHMAYCLEEYEGTVELLR